jgi:hypothetical protein
MCKWKIYKNNSDVPRMNNKEKDNRTGLKIVLEMLVGYSLGRSSWQTEMETGAWNFDLTA